jgi:hypothetical protein
MAAEGYHEPFEVLTPQTRDLHRAYRSLMEELEAADWYQQRVDAASDAELKAILAHNRDEEKEHASMLLEWIRRRDPAFDGHLREYIFSTGSITGREKETKEAQGAAAANAVQAPPSIGSLKGGN